MVAVPRDPAVGEWLGATRGETTPDDSPWVSVSDTREVRSHYHTSRLLYSIEVVFPDQLIGKIGPVTE